MARAITSPELALLRSDHQKSTLYLAIHQPATVYSALVNGAPASNDGVASVTFDGGSGTLANVIPGMTMYVGTSAGGYDLGMVRIRKTPTSSIFYIGITSDIEWADNAYLTVVDDFGIWAKHPVVSPTYYMDYDVAYTDQHTNLDPVPVLGPAAYALWLSGSTVSLAPDASGSWVIGSTITGYSWAAPGASATSGLSTATPTITYNTAGTYRIACTVSAANGKSFTGYRYVFVFTTAAPPVTGFQLDGSVTGSYDSGGWSFGVTIWDAINQATVRDRAMVCLFAKDWYGSTQQSIGPVPGAENVIAVGWIEGDSIEWNPAAGSVKFSAHGPNWWMDKTLAMNVVVEDYPSTVTGWTSEPDETSVDFHNLTTDMALWHVLHWRTTATLMMDVSLSGDTRLQQVIDGPQGSLWQQLGTLSAPILAKPCSDRYGRLFVNIDPQYLGTSARAALPVVQAITSTDWAGTIGIQRRSVNPMGMIEASGKSYDGTSSTLLIARAPGNFLSRFGSLDMRDNLLFEDQTDANRIAGLLRAKGNNEFPVINIGLASNQRMIDVCPNQYLTLSIAAGDTPRGIVWTNKKLIARRVEIKQDLDLGGLLTDLECEAETSAGLSVTIIPPAAPTSTDPTTPGFPDFPLFPSGPPESPSMNDCGGDLMAMGNGPYMIAFSPSSIIAGQSATCMFPCSVRLAGAFYPTELRMDGVTFFGDAASHYSVDAIDAGGAVVVSGTMVGGNVWRFAPISATNVAGFKISLTAGGVTSYAPGDVILSGSVGATVLYPSGVSATLTAGNYYSIEGVGGPWYSGANPLWIIAATQGSTPCTVGYSSAFPAGNIEIGGLAYDVLSPANTNIRGYFQASTTDYKIICGGDPAYVGSYSGSKSFYLRNAIVTNSRQAFINPCSLYNVCDSI